MLCGTRGVDDNALARAVCSNKGMGFSLAAVLLQFVLKTHQWVAGKKLA